MHEAGSREGELWRGRINEQESKLQLIRANFLERNLKESMIGQAENALDTNVYAASKCFLWYRLRRLAMPWSIPLSKALAQDADRAAAEAGQVTCV
jgi:hypothetical protein